MSNENESSKGRILCTVCSGITIENISRPEGLPIHGNLRELKDCGSTCASCKMAYEKVLDAPRLFSGSRKEWKTDHALGQLQAKAKRDIRFGDPCINVFIYNRGSGALESAKSNENLWLRIRTVEHDPAIENGIDWLRTLPLDTSAPATFLLAKEWIERCVAGNCGGPQVQVETRRESELEERPNRLIRLRLDRSDDLKLVASENLDASYAALSYT